MKLLLFIVFIQISFAYGLRGKRCKEYEEYNLITTCEDNPDVFSDTSAIIDRHGFPVENHTVYTKDGYILNVYRIPNPSGQPVFLQHGAAASSEWWVYTGNNSLAFRLARKGYDVWLGNTRGNYNSDERNHKTDKQYWNYTIDDMGNYDLPAVFDTIIKETNKRGEIIYVGHSQGTTEAMIYSITHRDEAKRNLKGLILICPVAKMNSTNKLLINFVKILDVLQIDHTGSSNNLLTAILQNFGSLMKNLANLSNYIYGPTNLYTAEYMPIFFRYLMSSESTLPLKQFAQMASSGKFEAYNHGLGSPKVYDLSMINVPVHLIAGKNDALANLTDVMIVHEEIKNSKLTVMQGYNHMNFFFSKNIDDFYDEFDIAINNLK
ncbi:PREDICTED: lipase member K-like [Nicrophorus vespilloides]|uniref:Lipase n=1 Tax=Nicrophorus vespilloides TaxID=110193 RepID=A0ABM1MU16_NICVS|nr:PREDICTED: lipase member K-like [Nicrophorus vespilloides]